MEKNLLNLSFELEKISRFDLSSKISDTMKSFEKDQKEIIILARTYYILLYTFLFPHKTELSFKDITYDIFISPEKFPDVPVCH